MKAWVGCIFVLFVCLASCYYDDEDELHDGHSHSHAHSHDHSQMEHILRVSTNDEVVAILNSTIAIKNQQHKLARFIEGHLNSEITIPSDWKILDDNCESRLVHKAKGQILSDKKSFLDDYSDFITKLLKPNSPRPLFRTNYLNEIIEVEPEFAKSAACQFHVLITVQTEQDDRIQTLILTAIESSSWSVKNGDWRITKREIRFD